MEIKVEFIHLVHLFRVLLETDNKCMKNIPILK